MKSWLRHPFYYFSAAMSNKSAEYHERQIPHNAMICSYCLTGTEPEKPITEDT